MTVSPGARQLTGLGAVLPPRAWKELLACGTMRHYRPGEVMLRQGTRGTYVLALAAGRAMVTRIAASGEEMIMAVGAPGEILGDMTVMDQARRSATVTALTHCTVHVLSSEQFDALIRRHEAVGAVATHAFARLREVELTRFELSTLPVAQRLVCALVRLVSINSDRCIDLSQDQLALLVGASRNAVVTALANLRAQGIVTTSRRRVTICDARALCELAAGDTALPGAARAV